MPLSLAHYSSSQYFFFLLLAETSSSRRSKSTGKQRKGKKGNPIRPGSSFVSTQWIGTRKPGKENSAFTTTTADDDDDDPFVDSPSRSTRSKKGFKKLGGLNTRGKVKKQNKNEVIELFEDSGDEVVCTCLIWNLMTFSLTMSFL